MNEDTMLVDKVTVREIINSIVGDRLALKRYKKSQITMPDAAKRQKGAIFITRTKQDLREAHGLVATSREAVFDNIGASHWTPNVYRYGTYAARGKQFAIIKGHVEDNLKAISCFVVDVDYPAEMKPSYWDFDASCFDVSMGKEGLLEPGLILNTPRGYQAYYILDTPVWIKRGKDGAMRSLQAAKHVSESIREAVAEQNPQTDTGANHFGFFRMPSETNILDVFEDSRCNFAALLRWSMARGTKRLREAHSNIVSDQVHSQWFAALASADVPNAHKSGYGRNNVLLTLCLAMYASGKDEQQALDFADEWASNQHAPLSMREIRAIVRSAYTGRYRGAQLNYVRELCDRYAPAAKPKATAHAWVHLAKSREDRQYSHQQEWMADLVKLVRNATKLQDGYAVFSVATLTKALGISRNSLTRLLDKLQTAATFAVKRVRGRNGGLYIATAQMIAKHLQEQKGTQHAQQAELSVTGTDDKPLPLDVFASVTFSAAAKDAVAHFLDTFKRPPIRRL